jgi:glutathione synthase/RimK-type ligase-like ATP-grasp enzyme
MKLQIAGIKRSRKYSPNQTTNDALIFLKTAQELNKHGASVDLYSEEDANIEEIREEIIFSMARGEDSINKLIQLQKNGVTIINPPQSTLNCYRSSMYQKLVESNIPFPKSIIVKTNSKEQFKISQLNERKIWVKRGDVHAIHREDVTSAYNDEELNFLLKEFANRGIREALLQEHIEGDVIKFYSVFGTDFFHWYYQNGNNNYKFSENHLRELAALAAEKLGVIVYGGDAIIQRDGSIILIDLNDWPSYAPVRNEASKIIAETIINRAVEFTDSVETQYAINK